MNETEQLPATSTASEANTLRRKQWRALIEIVVVLAITMTHYDGWTTPDRILKWVWGRPVPTDHNQASFVLMWINVTVVFVMIRLSGEPLAEFGIKRLNASVDILSGCLTFAADYASSIVGVDLFLQLLKDAFGRAYADQVSQQSWDVFLPAPSGLLSILALSITIGFSEELVMRGFLLTRLQRVTLRPWLSVWISSVFFACAHSNGGIVLVFNALLSGLVFGASFVLTRSLWPPVIAHALVDFVAILYLASKST